jgi:Skp family chaperone for outer membrane proteins
VLKVRVWSLIVALILGCLASTAWAQAPAASQAAGQAVQQITVAVVDVGYILKNHPTMKTEIEAIEGQMKAADDSMAQKRDAILKQMEQLREKYTEGTPEYDREEKSIAEQDTAFRLELVKMRKEFDTSRANVLYKVYGEITNLVKYASDQMGIQVVLRVSREKMDPKKPETIQMVMSQDVLHYNARVDLTDWVLKNLPGQAAATANAGAAPQR